MDTLEERVRQLEYQIELHKRDIDMLIGILWGAILSIGIALLLSFLT